MSESRHWKKYWNCHDCHHPWIHLFWYSLRNIEACLIFPCNSSSGHRSSSSSQVAGLNCWGNNMSNIRPLTWHKCLYGIPCGLGRHNIYDNMLEEGFRYKINKLNIDSFRTLKVNEIQILKIKNFNIMNQTVMAYISNIYDMSSPFSVTRFQEWTKGSRETASFCICIVVFPGCSLQASAASWPSLFLQQSNCYRQHWTQQNSSDSHHIHILKVIQMIMNWMIQ